jgi:hypothetical protein
VLEVGNELPQMEVVKVYLLDDTVKVGDPLPAGRFHPPIAVDDNITRAAIGGYRREFIGFPIEGAGQGSQVTVVLADVVFSDEFIYGDLSELWGSHDLLLSNFVPYSPIG